MAPTSKTRKAVKKAPAKKAASRKAVSTAPKQGTRSSKHGNVSYFSVPKENPECYRRCSPPYRHVDKPTGTRTTLVKYSHRNLTITSPGMSEQVRPAAKKTPAKKTTVKAPAKKKAPAKAAQCGCAVDPAKAPAKKGEVPANLMAAIAGGYEKKVPAKKNVPAKKTVSPGKAQVMADIQHREARRKAVEKILIDVSGIAGFTDVKFNWDPTPGRSLSTIRWARQGPRLVWDIPLRFADVDPKQVQNVFGYVLSHITGSGQVKDLSPSSVLELRRHGLKLKEYDESGARIPDAGKKRKAPAKTTAKKTVSKTVKAPAKKAPAKKTVSKTVSCGCAVTPAKPSKPKTVTCGCAQTPAQVKKAILDKAAKEGMNRKELDKHIIVATVPRIEAKEPVKAPASWKVPAVGGRFEGKAPAKSPEVTSISKKDLYEELGIPYKPRKTKKKPVEAAPAKRSPAAKGPAASRGVQGRFDAGALKAVAQFVHKIDRDLDMPIFSNDTQFVDSNHIMGLRLVSRMPGRSFVGLPLDPSKRDQAVPMESFIKRLNASVMDVYYQDGRLYYAWKDSPGLSVSTAVRESNNPNIRRFVWSRTSTEGDIKFRTSQAMFSKNVLSIVKSSGVKLPKMLTGKTSYKDTAMSMCPPDGSVDWDGGEVRRGCAGYSMYWMNQIAGLVAKAKGSQCIVMFKPNFPLRVVCDLGPYMAEIMLAPIATPEE